MSIKDKITPKMRKQFSQAIKKSKETGREHGFYMCIDDDGKLSATDMCVGDECSIKLHHAHAHCENKKVQGDFHTHPYLDDAKKYFNITFKASNQLMKESIRQFLEEKGSTITMPSNEDAVNAILGKCAKKTEGTTCIGSDLDNNRIECWTTKDIDDVDCVRVLVDRFTPYENKEKVSTMPRDWIKHLFNKEFIELKSVKK